LNLVFADKENIGWQVTGTFPLRGGGRGLFPSPGWSGNYDWRGLLESQVLPCAWNPDAGFIGTANNRTVVKDYPHVLSSSWYWPDRIERIMQMLTEKDQHTRQTCKTMQLDVCSLLAFKLRAVLDHVRLSEEIAAEIDGWRNWDRQKKARLVLSRLKSFDGEMRANSSDAVLLSAFLDRVTHNLFADEMGKEHSSAWEAFLVLNSEG
jgi:acyl-homoserine-lactone acylase